MDSFSSLFLQTDSKMSLDNRPTVFPKPKYVLDRIEKAKEEAARRRRQEGSSGSSSGSSSGGDSGSSIGPGGFSSTNSSAASIASGSQMQQQQQQRQQQQRQQQQLRQQPIPLMSTGSTSLYPPPAMHHTSGGVLLGGGGRDPRDPNGIMTGLLAASQAPPNINSQNFPSLGGGSGSAGVLTRGTSRLPTAQKETAGRRSSGLSTAVTTCGCG